MANIDRIIKISLALQTTGIAQQGFSDLMLIGVVTTTPRVSIITSPGDLLTGFGVNATSKIYLAAQVAFSQTPRPSRVFIGRRGSSETPADAIAAIAAENATWYGFTDVANNSADVLAYAAWAEANKKLFFAVLPTAALGAGGVAETLKTTNYYRTAWWYTADVATQFQQVAAMAKGFSKLPGADDWANMTLAATPSTLLSETVAQNIFTLNGNTFEPVRNTASTFNGKVAAGEWVDVIRGRDWLEEEASTRLYSFFLDRKVPYTDKGIASIENQLRGALNLAVTRGVLAPDEVNAAGKIVPSYTVTTPLNANISSVDKANRVLRDMSFTARLAGAIHAVEVSGTLVYNYAV